MTPTVPPALLPLLALLLAAPLPAAVELPTLFGDHMLLQRDRPLPIWGRAEPGERVRVTLAERKKETVADREGRWRVVLDPLPAGGPHRLLVEGNNRLQVEDVLVGELWLCSGQSNMAWTFRRRVTGGREAVAAADRPRLRLFTVTRATAAGPREDCQGEWRPCTPETVADFSAVAYFFGRELQRRLKVPLGLINSSWGGTRVEAWTSREALEGLPAAAPLLRAWREALARAGAKRRPKLLAGPHRPANLYNGMIAPLVPLALRGVIWYQGEANVSRACQYRQLFPALIGDWRRRFRRPRLPFAFVQLAPYAYRGKSKDALPELWEAQLLTLKSVPAVGMAVTTDIATPENIHPPEKQEVGRRLALWARAQVYGEKDLLWSGPIYSGWEKAGNGIRVRFDQVGSGLKTLDGKAPSHFALAGKDKRFHPARARIEGDRVVVTCPEVPDPVALRFAWSDTAMPNLANSAGLPASPFRTDRWPGLTVDRVKPW